MVTDRHIVATMADSFEAICPSPDRLIVPAGYRDSALALIDAVFSMQARYEGARRVVANYANWAGQLETPGLPVDPTAPDCHSISDLARRLGDLPAGDAAKEVFGNRSRHARTNRLKAELVVEAAQALVAVGLTIRQDVALHPSGEGYEVQKRAWRSVRGLGPVTFEYFRMLCGAESSKPDVMILRWLQSTLGKSCDWQHALTLMGALTDELSDRWGERVSQRAVDHTVWRHQSGRGLDPDSPTGWNAPVGTAPPPTVQDGVRMTARQEILEAARSLTDRGLSPFSPKQVIDELQRRGAHYPESTLRTYIVSAMCINAPTNHATTYPDLRRVGRGQYELIIGTTSAHHPST